MCWIGALVGCECGFRLPPPDGALTVWIFSSTEASARGAERFRARETAPLPPYVPEHMRARPMHISEVVDPSEELLRF